MNCRLIPMSDLVHLVPLHRLLSKAAMYECMVLPKSQSRLSVQCQAAHSLFNDREYRTGIYRSRRINVIPYVVGDTRDLHY